MSSCENGSMVDSAQSCEATGYFTHYLLSLRYTAGQKPLTRSQGRRGKT